MRKRLLFLATLLGLWLFGGVFMIQSYGADSHIKTQPIQQKETNIKELQAPLILELGKTSLPNDKFIYNNGRKNHRY